MRAFGIVLFWMMIASGCTPLRAIDDGGPEAVDARRRFLWSDSSVLDAGRDGAVDLPDAALPDGAAEDGSSVCAPGAAELCDGVDNDCDSATADGSDDPRYLMPCDGSDADSCEGGVYRCDGSWRCDDDELSIAEVCFNGIDEDCDLSVDENTGDVTGRRAYFEDADGDGFGRTTATQLCAAPTDGRYVLNGDDCNDANDSIPADSETCNGEDDDCDGEVDEDVSCGCVRYTYGGHTYQRCTTRLDRDGAIRRCSDNGYHLVKIETEGESAFLYGVILGVYWIGLERSSSSGTWMWHDGTAATYFDWGSGVQSYPYGVISGSSESWATSAASSYRDGVICEVP